MSSVQHLRQFISERLNAAAEAIFTEVEKTIVQYEEEIDRQRKLLEITWKPHRNVHTAEVPHQHVCKVHETVQDDQQLCNQKLDSNLVQEQPGPVSIKEEEEELLTSQEEELLLKDEIDNVSISAVHEENDSGDPESNGHHSPSYTFPADDSYLDGSRDEKSGPARYADGKPEKSHQAKTIENEESSLLESHYNTHHTAEKLFSCQACGKCFHRNYDLLRHMRTHTGEKPYSCKTCGECFSQSSAMLRHMRFHTGEKLFSCQACGKRFHRNYNLLCHVRTHTGEKPYSCKTCGKSFSHASDCMRHMRIHTGEKPYSCKICGKCFNQSSAMLRHMRTHTGEKPYSCQICGQSFCRKSNFLHHIRNCTGRKPYSC